MKKKRSNKMIVTLIVLLTGIISICVYFLVVALAEVNPPSKEVETARTPIPTAMPYVLNETGKTIIENISYIELTNCTNTTGDCGSACDGSTIKKITNLSKIEEIIFHLQVGKRLSELPTTDAPMEVCGGMKIDLYYTDTTYSSLQFATKNLAIFHEKAPVGSGPWKSLQYYQYETEKFYTYLVNEYNQL